MFTLAFSRQPHINWVLSYPLKPNKDLTIFARVCCAPFYNDFFGRNAFCFSFCVHAFRYPGRLNNNSICRDVCENAYLSVVVKTNSCMPCPRRGRAKTFMSSRRIVGKMSTLAVPFCSQPTFVGMSAVFDSLHGDRDC